MSRRVLKWHCTKDHKFDGPLDCFFICKYYGVGDKADLGWATLFPDSTIYVVGIAFHCPDKHPNIHLAQFPTLHPSNSPIRCVVYTHESLSAHMGQSTTVYYCVEYVHGTHESPVNQCSVYKWITPRYTRVSENAGSPCSRQHHTYGCIWQ